MFTLRLEYCMEQWERPFGYKGQPADEAVQEAERLLQSSMFAKVASKARLFDEVGKQVKAWDIGVQVS